MGVDLLTPRREFLNSGAVRVRERAATRVPWWLLGLMVVAIACIPVLIVRAGAPPIRSLPRVLAPLVGTVGWAYAARRALSRPRVAFLVFAGAGAVAVAGEMLALYERYVWSEAGAPLALYVFLVPNILIAAGAVLAMGQRRRSVWAPGLRADAALLLMAALVVTLRLGVEPLLSDGASHAELATLAVAHTIVVVPALVAALVLLRGTSTLSSSSAVLLFLATAVFGATTLLSTPGLEAHPLRMGDGFDVAWMAGWLLFGAAGYRARGQAPTASAMLMGRRAHDLVRSMIVPGVSLLLGGMALDVAIRGAASVPTLGAMAVLTLLLAFRTAQALKEVERGADHRRQLAHTQALVDVSHSLAGTTDLDAILTVISEAARRVFGTRAAGIELLTEDGRTLETRAVVGMPEDVVGLRFPLEGSFTGWVVLHGEPRATVDPTRDPYIQPESLAFLGRWPVAAAPIQFREQTFGALFTCIRSDPFEPEELHLLGAMAEQAGIGIKTARLFEQVRTLSITDPLTGLANRRQLQREMEREFAAARRGRRLVAVMFDLDTFKAYNDTYGHLAGDEALAAFGRALRDETRTMNLAARYGGDEFVALLSDSSAEGAEIFVERVRSRFAEALRKLGQGELLVSAGIAPYADHLANAEELLRNADAALYRDKPAASTNSPTSPDEAKSTAT